MRAMRSSESLSESESIAGFLLRLAAAFSAGGAALVEGSDSLELVSTAFLLALETGLGFGLDRASKIEG